MAVAGITEFRDFELTVSEDGPNFYAQVMESPAGESSRVQIKLPFDPGTTLLRVENAILRSIKQVRSVGRLESDLREIGEGLFSSLMLDKEISQLYASSRGAIPDGATLRVKLRVDSDSLAALPWEYFYDSLVVQDFLGLHAQTSVVRYTALRQPQKELLVEGPLRILGMVANPKKGAGYANLDATVERERIERGIRKLHESGDVDFQWVFGESSTELYDALYKRGPWHAFHFIGHGGIDAYSKEGFIVLTKESGEPEYIFGKELRRLLTTQTSLRLVVLNCCDSGRGPGSVAKELVTGGVPAVLAMQYPISDEVAIELSTGFYTALASGQTVDGAVTGARIKMNLRSKTEWGIPVLFMRSHDGRIFERAQLRPAAGKESVTVVPVIAPVAAAPILVTPAAPAPPAPPAAVAAAAGADDFDSIEDAVAARDAETDLALSGDENLESWSLERLALLADEGQKRRTARKSDTRLDRRLAAIYFQLCTRYRKDNVNKAFVSITTAIDLDPAQPDYYYTRANLFARGDQFDLAMKDMAQALKLAPDRAEFHWAKGLTCLLAARTGMQPQFLNDAVRDFDNAIRLDPNLGKYYSSRGAANHRLGNLDAALADLATALRLDPNDAKTYFNRAQIRLQQQAYDEAESDLQSATRLGYTFASRELQRLITERSTRH